MNDWKKTIPVAITVCDKNGTIIEMNDKSRATFLKPGDPDLIGHNLMACHPPHAQQKIRQLLATGTTNTYTIEKNGIKKLIHQAPWFQNGEVAGLVELSIEIPAEMPHYIRTPNKK